MGMRRFRIDKGTEHAIYDMFKSRAEARIYLFLLRKNGARSDQIVKGTHLHPSTVRELLVRMYQRRVISRKKLRNDSIGKNPYVYHVISPVVLLQKYARELEARLNKLANLSGGESKHVVKIKISGGDDNA